MSQAPTPTDEQAEALDLFATGDDLVIQAGAGTGKTTTLAMCARTTPRKGAYLVFNKAIAIDASRKMPMTVEARTVHSIAARALRTTPGGRELLARLDTPRMSPWQLAKLMGVGPIMIEVKGASGTRTKVLQPGYLAGHVMRAIARFCQSADDQPGVQHFPYVEGIDMPDGAGRTFRNNRNLSRELLPTLEDAWADVCRPGGRLKFTPDVYLKLWQLAGYRVPADFILFDEAQDASPVMLAALANQGDAQVVYVGDSQQQIYEWRGAIDALARIESAPTTYLTQSWRFGQPIAELANLILARLYADLRLTGAPGVDSVVHHSGRGPRANAVLTRTNGAAMEAVINAQAEGRTAHLVGGNAEAIRFATAAAKLQNGETVSHRDLACFENWQQVQEYVADDPQGGELRTLVQLLDDYGVQIVLDALDGVIGEDQADVIVSTAHKAKGREWPVVRLASDFELPDGDRAPDLAPEWRLLYVAATRAMGTVDISTCKPLYDLHPAEPVPAGPDPALLRLAGELP